MTDEFDIAELEKEAEEFLLQFNNVLQMLGNLEERAETFEKIQASVILSIQDLHSHLEALIRTVLKDKSEEEQQKFMQMVNEFRAESIVAMKRARDELAKEDGESDQLDTDPEPTV